MMSLERRKQSREYHLKLGYKLRKARNDVTISQIAMGEYLGISFQQVQKYEKGDNRICVFYLHLWATLCGVPLRWFFDDEA